MSKLDFIKKLYNGKNCYSDHMNKDELGFLHISSGVEPLVSDMLDKHKLVFLTGNPGDGKTFIIKAIEPCIIRNNVFVKTDFNEVTNYADAARNIVDLYVEKKPAVFAINEYPFLRLCKEIKRINPDIYNEIMRAKKSAITYELSEPIRHIAVVDLNERNLLTKDNQLLDTLLTKMTDLLSSEPVHSQALKYMLIAGTTGSGKTIFLYSIIVSLLHKYPMEDLEFLIIDPKQTDFVFFEDLPNLYGGHVVVDAEEALEMIQRINDVDKEGRMQQLRFCRSRDIGSYNEKNPDHRMKRLIIIIDEYADLIQTAEMQGKRKEFEKFLSMLAQKVRSLGIHLIIATQRPSANIVTGVLKANIPYRISFRLPSHTDSQTILDMPGAENLLGKGDMLMVTDSDTIRMQGLYISEDELDNFVKSRQ